MPVALDKTTNLYDPRGTKLLWEHTNDIEPLAQKSFLFCRLHYISLVMLRTLEKTTKAWALQDYLQTLFTDIVTG